MNVSNWNVVRTLLVEMQETKNDVNCVLQAPSHDFARTYQAPLVNVFLFFISEINYIVTTVYLVDVYKRQVASFNIPTFY